MEEKALNNLFKTLFSQNQSIPNLLRIVQQELLSTTDIPLTEILSLQKILLERSLDPSRVNQPFSLKITDLPPVFVDWLVQTLFFLDQTDQSLQYIEKRFAIKDDKNNDYLIFYILSLSASTQESSLPIIQKLQSDLLEQYESNKSELNTVAYYLIHAENARRENHWQNAINNYDSAIHTAKLGKLIQYEALANELTANFWIQQNKRKIAQVYFNDAYEAYQKWGCHYRSQKIKQTYKLVTKEKVKEYSNRSICENLDDSEEFEKDNTLAMFIQLLTLSQTISGEIEMESLIKKMMHIIITGAQAEYGALVFRHQDQYYIEAQQKNNEDVPQFLQSKPLEQTRELPISVIQHVAKTKKFIAIPDAIHDKKFSDDPYIQKHQVKSILTLPVHYKKRLIAIVYLENNSSIYSFHKDCIHMLEVLLIQSAISLENAYLYKKLQNRLKLYKKTEHRLADAHNRWKSLVDCSPTTITLINFEGEILFINRVSYPYKKGNIIGTSIFDVFQAEEEKIVREHCLFVQKHQKATNYKIMLVLDGKPRWWISYLGPVFSEGKLVACIINSIEITKQKEAEEQLQKLNDQLEKVVTKRTKDLEQSTQTVRETQQKLMAQEKLAFLGSLTAGIAHEVKNPLNFINNYAEINLELSNDLQKIFQKYTEIIPQTEFQEILEILNDFQYASDAIYKNGHRANQIIESMLFHFRNKQSNKVAINLNQLIRDNLDFAYEGARAKKAFDVQIQTQFSPHLPIIEVLAQDLGRVFLNLFDNSFDSLYEKQKHNNNFEACLKITTTLKQTHIEIKVHDNGLGISQESQKQIFEPFFTTKSSGEGTGLGLSISLEIIKGHQGSINLESKVGSFTTFNIVLPIN